MKFYHRFFSLSVCVASILFMTACRSASSPTSSAESDVPDPEIELYHSADVDSNGNPYETSGNTEHRSKLSELKIHFIDVGQADCTLIQYPNGDNFLIDGGNREDAEDIIYYLKMNEVTEFKGIIATHPHEDHIGGLPAILDEFPVQTFYMPEIPDEHLPTTKIYESLLESCERNKVSITTPVNGKNIYAPQKYTYLQVLYNGCNGTEDYNTYSIVTKLHYGDNDCLFTGDATAAEENWMMTKYPPDVLDCDILKAGHHGSNTSNQQTWIDTVTPSYIFIPCETDNPYGHPHPSTMHIFEGTGAEIYDMSQSGTCYVVLNGIDADIAVTDKVTGEYPLGSDLYQNEINNDFVN